MGNTVVITGANRGIGLSLARQYHESGAKVFAICRKKSPALEKIGAQVIDGIDLQQEESASILKESLQGVSINCLINNAGILRNEILGDINYKTIQEQFQVNTLAPLRISEALKDQLNPGEDGFSRLVFITSRMGSIEDNTSGGRYGYRMSKAALNMAAVSLSSDLSANGVAVGILHPGLVGTDMIGGAGDLTPDEAAAKLILRIKEITPDTTGQFRHSNGQSLPW